MKKPAVIVSVLILAGSTLVVAHAMRMETPRADCLVWWRLGSPLTAYHCLTDVKTSYPGDSAKVSEAQRLFQS